MDLPSSLLLLLLLSRASHSFHLPSTFIHVQDGAEDSRVVTSPPLLPLLLLLLLLSLPPLFFLFPFTSPAHCTHRRPIDTDSRNDCSRVTGHDGICDFAFVPSFKIRRGACAPLYTDRFDHEISGIFTRPIEFLSLRGYNRFRET